MQSIQQKKHKSAKIPTAHSFNFIIYSAPLTPLLLSLLYHAPALPLTVSRQADLLISTHLTTVIMEDYIIIGLVVSVIFQCENYTSHRPTRVFLQKVCFYSL